MKSYNFFANEVKKLPTNIPKLWLKTIRLATKYHSNAYAFQVALRKESNFKIADFKQL
jgi:hypothetical protein